MKASSKKQSPNTLIRCGKLLTMKGGRVELLEDQALAITGSEISFIGPWKKTKLKAKKTIDATRKLVMPGLINAHTHLAMSHFRGIAGDLPFYEWYFQHIMPLEKRLVSPEFMRLGVELSLLEGLMSGTTTFCDMFFFSNETAAIVDKVGARAVISQHVADFPAYDAGTSKEKPYEFLDEFQDKFKGHGRIQASVGCHAPYSCSDETFKRGLAYAQKHNILLHIHVSESRKEVEDSLKEFKERPVERLARLGVLEHFSLFAHCVHVNEKEIQLLANSKVSVAHNPECNMKLGSGAAPVVQMLKAGVKLSLGTDGPASNNNLNMFEEMGTATKLQKLVSHEDVAMSAETTLRMATLGGAQALGLGERTGSLEVGKYADLLIIDMDQPQMQPLHDIASQLVYAANGSEVETVFCHGKILVENRKPKTVKPLELYERIAKYRKKNNF